MDIGPLQHRSKNELLGTDGFDIFHAVYRAVDFALAERVVQFLGPQRLAANFGQRTVEDLVAAGDHRHQFHLLGSPGMGGQQRIGGHPGLRHRQR